MELMGLQHSDVLLHLLWMLPDINSVLFFYTLQPVLDKMVMMVMVVVLFEIQKMIGWTV